MEITLDQRIALQIGMLVMQTIQQGQIIEQLQARLNEKKENADTDNPS